MISFTLPLGLYCMELKTGVTRILTNIIVWLNTGNIYLYTADIDECGCRIEFDYQYTKL